MRLDDRFGGQMRRWWCGIYADHRYWTRREESPRRFSRSAACAKSAGRGLLDTAAAVQHRHDAGGRQQTRFTFKRFRRMSSVSVACDPRYTGPSRRTGIAAHHGLPRLFGNGRDGPDPGMGHVAGQPLRAGEKRTGIAMLVPERREHFVEGVVRVVEERDFLPVATLLLLGPAWHERLKQPSRMGQPLLEQVPLGVLQPHPHREDPRRYRRCSCTAGPPWRSPGWSGSS